MAEVVIPSTGTSGNDTAPAQKQNSSFPHPLSAANVEACSASPLTIVGSSTGGLDCYPVGSDVASQSGLKTQKYTSSSSSYLCTFSVRFTSGGSLESVVLEDTPEGEIAITSPTQTQLAALTERQRRNLSAGRLVYKSQGQVMKPTAFKEINMPGHRMIARTKIRVTNTVTKKYLSFEPTTAEDVLREKPVNISESVLIEAEQQAKNGKESVGTANSSPPSPSTSAAGGKTNTSKR